LSPFILLTFINQQLLIQTVIFIHSKSLSVKDSVFITPLNTTAMPLLTNFQHPSEIEQEATVFLDILQSVISGDSSLVSEDMTVKRILEVLTDDFEVVLKEDLTADVDRYFSLVKGLEAYAWTKSSAGWAPIVHWFVLWQRRSNHHPTNRHLINQQSIVNN
jgi:hypothetical protein